EYLHEIAGDAFTAKDFRTWAGTVLAAEALRECETALSHTQAKRNTLTAIEAVANRLGNTKAICRKCYVHPTLIDAYLDGSLPDFLKRHKKTGGMRSLGALHPEEAVVLAFLQERVKRALNHRA